jgi:hypothetical protein
MKLKTTCTILCKFADGSFREWDLPALKIREALAKALKSPNSKKANTDLLGIEVIARKYYNDDGKTTFAVDTFN